MSTDYRYRVLRRDKDGELLEDYGAPLDRDVAEALALEVLELHPTYTVEVRPQLLGEIRKGQTLFLSRHMPQGALRVVVKSFEFDVVVLSNGVRIHRGDLTPISKSARFHRAWLSLQEWENDLAERQQLIADIKSCGRHIMPPDTSAAELRRVWNALAPESIKSQLISLEELHILRCALGLESGRRQNCYSTASNWGGWEEALRLEQIGLMFREYQSSGVNQFRLTELGRQAAGFPPTEEREWDEDADYEEPESVRCMIARRMHHALQSV